MANKDQPNPEEKIICPYNSSHHIRRMRMNTHLVKCKKSYPDAKLVECDFNENHKIPEPELQYHHENCPDRRKLEICIYQEENVDINKYPIQNIEVSADESWDHINVESYDPKKACENKEVLRHLDVESAAKRRDFRIAERKRIGQIMAEKKGISINQHDNGFSNNQPSTSRRQLPPPRRPNIEEDTPDEIQAILERIKLGHNKAFIPK